MIAFLKMPVGWGNSQEYLGIVKGIVILSQGGIVKGIVTYDTQLNFASPRPPSQATQAFPELQKPLFPCCFGTLPQPPLPSKLEGVKLDAVGIVAGIVAWGGGGGVRGRASGSERNSLT